MAITLTTTTTITELTQAVIQEARLWFTAASLFYPRTGVATKFLQWADLTNRPGIAATFNKYSAISFGNGVEDTDYTSTSAMDTTGAVTVTAARKVINVPISDLAEMASVFGPEKLIADLGRQIGVAAATKFDGDVIALFDNLGSTPTGGNSTGTPMTAAEFRAYPTGLQTAKIPGPYAAIFHPWGWYEFLGESSSPLVNAAASDQVAKQVYQEFYATNLFGAQIFVHPDVATDGTDYQGAFMSPWAIGCTWKKDLSIRPQRDESAGWTEYVADMYYGVGVIDTTAGYVMLQDDD